MDKLKDKQILQFEVFSELYSKIKWFENFDVSYCKKGLFEKEQFLKGINFNFLKDRLSTLFREYSIKGTIFKNSESKREGEFRVTTDFSLLVNAEIGTTKFETKFTSLDGLDLMHIDLQHPTFDKKLYSLNISGKKEIFYPNHPSIFVKYKQGVPVFF